MFWTPNTVRSMFAALAYGFLRKAVELKDATVWVPDPETQKDTAVPLFVVDKVGIAAMAGFSSIILWPAYVVSDLYKMERQLRPELARMYPLSYKKRHALDYLF